MQAPPSRQGGDIRGILMLVQTVIFFSGKEILPRLFLWEKLIPYASGIRAFCFVYCFCHYICIFSNIKTITDVAGLLEM
jgi:hypothetical protein